MSNRQRLAGPVYHLTRFQQIFQIRANKNRRAFVLLHVTGRVGNVAAAVSSTEKNTGQRTMLAMWSDSSNTQGRMTQVVDLTADLLLSALRL